LAVAGAPVRLLVISRWLFSRTAHGGIVGIWLGYRFGEEESRPEQAHHDKLAT